MENQKMWIFIITKELNHNQLQDLLHDCKNFVSTWLSHKMPLDASVEIIHNRFLIIKNNQDFNAIGGCSADKMFNFITSLEKKYNTDLLNRRLIVLENTTNEIEIYPLEQLEELISKDIINEQTYIYNPTINHSSDWSQFRVLFGKSWLHTLAALYQ